MVTVRRGQPYPYNCNNLAELWLHGYGAFSDRVRLANTELIAVYNLARKFLPHLL